MMLPPISVTRRQFLSATAAASMNLALSSGSLVAAPSPEPFRHKLIGFTKPFQKLNHEEVADTVAEIGWDGVECPVRPKGQGHFDPERAAEELPKLVDALRKRGKEITLLTTAITSLSQPHAESLLRTAAGLGIRRYRLGFWKYDLNRSIANQVDEISAQLRELASFNRQLGLHGGVQNHSGHDYVGAPLWDLWTMMKELDPHDVGICFDIGHATLEGGLSWMVDARLAASRFTAVFVKDFLWRKSDQGWREQWVQLGEGMVDRSFFTWLKTISFQGPICLHHEYDHGEGRPMIARMQKDLATLKTWLA